MGSPGNWKQLKPAVWWLNLTHTHIFFGTGLIYIYVKKQLLKTSHRAAAICRRPSVSCREALRRSGWALRFACPKLRADRHLVLEAHGVVVGNLCCFPGVDQGGSWQAWTPQNVVFCCFCFFSGVWHRGVHPHFCDIRESPPSIKAQACGQGLLPTSIPGNLPLTGALVICWHRCSFQVSLVRNVWVPLV